MKIFLSCLVIIILFVIIICKFKSRKVRSVEGFFVENMAFRKKFPEDFMGEEYKLYLRETGDSLFENIVPTSFKYIYLEENLVDKINNTYVALVKNCLPNVILKVTIPDEEFKKTYIRYKISIQDKSIDAEYENFLYYHYFKLSGVEENIVESSSNMSKLNILQTYIEEKNFEEISNHDSNFNIIYELPTRLEGDSRDSDKQIILMMLMFYFKYQLEIDIYSETKDTPVDDTLDKLKVFYEIGGESKEIKKVDKEDSSTSQEVEISPGYNYINNLFTKTIDLLIDDNDTVDISNKNNFARERIELEKDKNPYIYNDTSKPYHCKKIKKIVLAIFYYFKMKLEECRVKEEKKIGEGEDEKILERILEYYVTEDAALVSPYSTFIKDKYQANFTDLQKTQEANKKEHQMQYLEENKILGEKMLKEYEKLSSTLKPDFEDLDIKMLYDDINNLLTTKKLQLNKKILKYDLDLSALSPQKPFTIVPSTDLSEEEKEINKLKNMKISKRLLYLIQKDLRKVLRNRRGNFFDQREFKISNNLKKELLVLRKNLTSSSDLKRVTAEKNIDYVKLLMDMVKTGRVDIINHIVDFDINKSRFILINKLKKLSEKKEIPESGEAPAPGSDAPEEFKSNSNMIGSYIKTEKYRQNFKKNMDDIYNRYMDFKIKAESNKKRYDESVGNITDLENDTVYEDFNNLVQHKHVDSGQINFLRDAQEVSRDDFEKIDWLKKPENQRLVATYQFLSEGQKKGIVKEIDDMETNLYQLKDFTETNYSEMKEKLNMLEAKAKEELRLREEEENMTDLERAVRDFQFKEKDQESKMKSMNEKIDKLEKEQKGLNLARFDKINSVRSMGDGQVLSVFNLKDNQYQIQANSGCVKQGKKSLEMEKCGNQKEQQFNLHHINNASEYNQHLPPGSPIVQDYAEISYPFHLITPSDNKKRCVSMHGNKMSMADCADSKYHRFETLQKFKKCDSKYGN